MTLKNLIESDIRNVFFKDDTEFNVLVAVGTSSRNARMIYATLQSNTIDNNSGNAAPLQQFSHTFGCAFEDVEDLNLHAGSTLYIKNTSYRIVSMTIEMGVLTAILQKG